MAKKNTSCRAITTLFPVMPADKTRAQVAKRTILCFDLDSRIQARDFANST